MCENGGNNNVMCIWNKFSTSKMTSSFISNGLGGEISSFRM